VTSGKNKPIARRTGRGDIRGVLTVAKRSRGTRINSFESFIEKADYSKRDLGERGAGMGRTNSAST